jgi:diketogulonate reductase-like aldo/keto reductase
MPPEFPEEWSFKNMPRTVLLCAGVSNFDMLQLNELRATARIQPAVVQRNSDPFSQDAEMRSYCRLAGIQYQV